MNHYDISIDAVEHVGHTVHPHQIRGDKTYRIPEGLVQIDHEHGTLTIRSESVQVLRDIADAMNAAADFLETDWEVES